MSEVRVRERRCDAVGGKGGRVNEERGIWAARGKSSVSFEEEGGGAVDGAAMIWWWCRGSFLLSLGFAGGLMGFALLEERMSGYDGLES